MRCCPRIFYIIMEHHIKCKIYLLSTFKRIWSSILMGVPGGAFYMSHNNVFTDCIYVIKKIVKKCHF